MRRLLGIALGLILLAGCGTSTFVNRFSVSVTATQDVSVFDSLMGESAEWAERTIGPAGPGQPYTTEIAVTDTKMVFDGSPPTSLRFGLYLPSVTPDGYFAISLPDAAAGPVAVRAPFVRWYLADPEAPAPTDLPVSLVLAEGPDGWLVSITVAEQP